MRSGRWSFNTHLFKRQVKRFWPLWSVYSVVLFLMVPVYLILESQQVYKDKILYNAIQHHLTILTTEVAPVMAFVVGLVLAMAIWSYLYQQRSVSLFHALPLSREGLFLTNFITGIAFFLVPNLVVFLLALGVQAAIGAMAVGSLAAWFLCQTLLCFFYFSFATLIAFITGHLIVLPCLFLVFNYLAKVLGSLLNWTFMEFIYGYTHDSVGWLNWLQKWLSPPVALRENLIYSYPRDYYSSDMEANQYLLDLCGISTVAVYAVVGLVMVGLAYLFYRRRKLERCGDIVSIAVLRPVFTYGVAICGGLSLGNICYRSFYGLFPQGLVTLLLFFLLCSALCYFAAEMLQRKSFCIFKETVKGYLVLALVLIVVMVAMEMDITGYERTVPQLDQVESVRGVYARNVVYDDPDYAEAVIALHEALLAEKSDIERKMNGKDPEFSELVEYVQRENGVWYQEASWSYIQLEYTLKNGKTLRRAYQIPVTRESLEDSSTAAALYASLTNVPEWTLTDTFPSALREEDLATASIQIVNIQDQDQEHGSYINYKYDTIAGEACDRLYAAVVEDILAGRLGVNMPIYNEDYLKEEMTNYLSFTFRGDYSELYYYDNYYYQRNSFFGSYSVPEHYWYYTSDYEAIISLQVSATSTIRVLEELGYELGSNLITRYDLEQYYD